MARNCREYFDRISEFIDGNLDNEICKKIQAHLEECTDCQDCIESLKKTISLCKNSPKDEISAECHERIMKAISELKDS